MDILAQIVQKIIQEQEKIIGPIALEQAKQVEGLFVDWEKREVRLAGDEKSVLENLVKKYQSLFGRASVEVCKEAIGSITDKISPNNLPDILKS
jgi:hypothetical protein